ncbi:FAD/NAD-binding domain-containing protein [Auriculariales sp. MPI-PUGE-AT-0066]|nr:FAD/NAD-binding domain-containing protein [Auriculariales sp. MPI-PUGE-AT-0066]
MSDSFRRIAVVVGGGPVGCLTALSLAKLGWRVELYEGRPDPRLPSSKAAHAQRSINLAISSRGLSALAVVDPAIASRFLETVIPMRARMIHESNGRTSSQLYDIHGQCINSIDRSLLNDRLLDEAAASPYITISFKHKLTQADFDARRLEFQTPAGPHKAQFDLCVGSDGSYSNVRRQMMRFVRLDFEQEYIPHEYVELRMPPGLDSKGKPCFRMEPNYLHIWPRQSFMLIALPNKDMSFTCTLFAPTEELDKLLPPFSFQTTGHSRQQSPTPAQSARVATWFSENFSDAVNLIGEDVLVHDFWHNPRSPLVCVKANPYHYRDRVILLGDAAHAMTPFFGQGLNCGLEDVRVLSTVLKTYGVDPTRHPSGDEDTNLARTLQMYTDTRREDLLAISQMAMDNYSQMRDHVTRPAYLLRKAIEEMLYRLTSKPTHVDFFLPALACGTFTFPSDSKGRLWEWVPLYNMVTFRPDISYAMARRKAERQGKLLSVTGWVVLAASLTSAAMWIRRRS